MKVVDSDEFLNLPDSAQALYFHLGMRADDDGFIGNSKRLVGYLGGSSKDLSLLIEKRFLLKIDNVLVIKHWKINNYIQKDRYSPTSYQDQLSKLIIKENGSYTECKNKISATDTNTDPFCIQNGTTEEKEREKEENKKTMCNADADALFEKLWSMYPSKRGKGQVSEAKKRRLLDIGFKEMERAITRYKADLAENTWRKPQNGSTFFNSGYVDYLDKNYQGDMGPEVVRKPDEQDRFSVLDPKFRKELETAGVIEGESLVLGNATKEQISQLQKVGVL